MCTIFSDCVGKQKPWDRLFDFYFMLSLLLPSRVSMCLTAVLASTEFQTDTVIFRLELRLIAHRQVGGRVVLRRNRYGPLEALYHADRF